MKSLIYHAMFLSLILVSVSSFREAIQESEEDDLFGESDLDEVENRENVDSEDEVMSDDSSGTDDNEDGEMMGSDEKAEKNDKQSMDEESEDERSGGVEKSKIQNGSSNSDVSGVTDGAKRSNKDKKRGKAAHNSDVDKAEDDGKSAREKLENVEKGRKKELKASKAIEGAKQGSEVAEDSGEDQDTGDILGQVVQMSEEERKGRGDSKGSESGSLDDARTDEKDKEEKDGGKVAEVARTRDSQKKGSAEVGETVEPEVETGSEHDSEATSGEASRGLGKTNEKIVDKSKNVKHGSEGNSEKLKNIAGLNEKEKSPTVSLDEQDYVKDLLSLRGSDKMSTSSGENGKLKEAGKDGTTPKKDKSNTVKSQNVQDLLKDLVPSGIIPDVPEGFTKLSDMSTISFTYNVDENNEVTVTSDIKKPMELFKGKLTLTDAKMTFNYKDKGKKGQRWQFDVRAKWINGQQVFDVNLENSKHDDHFTLTGEGDTLALQDYASIFVTSKAFEDSGMDMDVLGKTALSQAEIYIVFKDDVNLVCLVSGKADISPGKPSLVKTYIQKLPKKDPIFSIFIDFQDTTPLSVLSSTVDDKLSDVPFVKQLLDNKGLLKIDNGGFGFVASSEEVDKLRLNVFGEGMLEKKLGSHVSAGVTLMLPMLIHSQNNAEKHNMVVKVSRNKVHFSPTDDRPLNAGKALKTLSEFTRPKITALGYPDVTQVIVKEMVYDLSTSTYAVFGHAPSQFDIIPGVLSLEESALEFRQLLPDEFATLALFGDGTANVGASAFNVSVRTDTASGELFVEGKARSLWSADIGQALGIALEMDAETKKILGDNHMLNVNIENAQMFAVVKDGGSELMHFYGSSRPALWNDPLQVEAVVFHDAEENRKRITMGYLFDKLPLTYAIDALSFAQFPSPRLLDNSRNSTLVWSPTNTESMFLNPAMNGLSFMRGLSLVGQFRLPDVCSLNTECESAAKLLGTEKWYRVQGLVSTRGYTVSGYVDKEFTLAEGLTLKDNVMEFSLGNYSYMRISTALYLDKNNLTFRGYITFDNSGVRLRMTSNDLWSSPFPASFVTFDRLQIDAPFVSGMPVDGLLITGELNFGLPGSLYRIFAPAYLTYKPKAPKRVAFQATLSNVTMETIASALNYKSTLPEVLRNSRFPESLVARYTPDSGETQKLELYGKMRLMKRTVICKMRIDDEKRLTASTSHSKYPLILDDGLVMVYANQNETKLGPRVVFTVSPDKSVFKLTGYATFMGLGTKTEIDVSQSGTEFSLYGNLFGLTKTVVSIMSPDSLPENGPYIASACIPEVIPQVVKRVHAIFATAADHAQGYIKEASKNFQKANVYHNEVLAKEQKYKEMLDEVESNLEVDDRDLFVAEERFNRTCKEEQCDKTCIGCTAWHKCCDRDVFGNCVKCPGWKTCCWHGMSPICRAKNHGCRIMKQLAADNLQRVAKRVYKDKDNKGKSDETVWKSEYLKGKTQAVLDAARRALDLVNHDSQIGLGAAASIKRFGLQRLVNIQSVCFQTSLKTLATSCVRMKINATFGDEPSTRSIPYYGCLNKELVPKMANYITSFMFFDMSGAKQKENAGNNEGSKAINDLKSRIRRGSIRSSIFRRVLPEENDDVTEARGAFTKGYKRRRRDENDGDNENRPFWLMRNNFQSHSSSLLQQRTTVPRSPLKKKWQIPASRTGKCKVYRQLVEICKDMVSTVKLMFNSYQDGKEQFLKRKTELELGLNASTADLEKQAAETPELTNRLEDIEMNIRTVNAGVSQWKLNCKADQEDQNNMAVQEWVSTMEERIRKLGGQGVERFLSNLFRAFEGMFLGTDTPKNNAEEVLNTLQSIREISATFHDIFNNNGITLEKANSRAEIVLGQLKHIKKTKLFCDK